MAESRTTNEISLEVVDYNLRSGGQMSAKSVMYDASTETCLWLVTHLWPSVKEGVLLELHLQHRIEISEQRRSTLASKDS